MDTSCDALHPPHGEVANCLTDLAIVHSAYGLRILQRPLPDLVHRIQARAQYSLGYAMFAIILVRMTYEELDVGEQEVDHNEGLHYAICQCFVYDGGFWLQLYGLWLTLRVS